jgi:phosphonate transport system substrate-binding protein
MANEPSMKALLDRVQMPNPVPADYARDYKPLEKLNLEKYVVFE